MPSISTSPEQRLIRDYDGFIWHCTGCLHGFLLPVWDWGVIQMYSTISTIDSLRYQLFDSRLLNAEIQIFAGSQDSLCRKAVLKRVSIEKYDWLSLEFLVDFRQQRYLSRKCQPYKITQQNATIEGPFDSTSNATA